MKTSPWINSFPLRNRRGWYEIKGISGWGSWGIWFWDGSAFFEKPGHWIRAPYMPSYGDCFRGLAKKHK